MFGTLQATTVWLTTAMLLAQAMCPGLVGGCGCQQSNASCCSTDAKESDACCCASSEEDTSQGCPQCQAASGNSEPAVQGESVCHCGRQAPAEPTMPGIPESPNPSILLDWIAGNFVCFTAAPLLSPAPVHSQVLSSEALILHFKQVVHCVWLT